MPDQEAAVYILNEIVGTSSDSLDAAVRNGLARAARTLKHLDWFEVVQVRGTIRDGDVGQFQVKLNVGMRLLDREQLDAER